VEAAIKVTWDVTLRVGDRTETIHSEETDAATA
jgi:hypothetical protein